MSTGNPIPSASLQRDMQRYLEDYAEVLENLPMELQRSYTLLAELDHNANDLMNKVGAELRLLPGILEPAAASQSTGTTDAPPATPTTTFELYARLKPVLDQLHRLGEQKVALAQQVYETVDAQCNRLDRDLSCLEEDEELYMIGGSAMYGRDGDSSRKRKGETSGGAVVSSNGRAPKKRSKETGRKPTLGAGANSTSGRRNDAIAASHARLQKLLIQTDMPIDPSEPTYCYCHEVSYGEMVACDNNECEIEWFHYPCVGLVTKPKGSWYCPDCRKTKR